MKHPIFNEFNLRSSKLANKMDPELGARFCDCLFFTKDATIVATYSYIVKTTYPKVDTMKCGDFPYRTTGIVPIETHEIGKPIAVLAESIKNMKVYPSEDLEWLNYNAFITGIKEDSEDSLLGSTSKTVEFTSFNTELKTKTDLKAEVIPTDVPEMVEKIIEGESQTTLAEMLIDPKILAEIAQDFAKMAGLNTIKLKIQERGGLKTLCLEYDKKTTKVNPKDSKEKYTTEVIQSKKAVIVGSAVESPLT